MPLTIFLIDLHGTLSANNSSKYNLVTPLEALPGFKRWPVQTPWPPLLGVLTRIDQGYTGVRNRSQAPVMTGGILLWCSRKEVWLLKCIKLFSLLINKLSHIIISHTSPILTIIHRLKMAIKEFSFNVYSATQFYLYVGTHPKTISGWICSSALSNQMHWEYICLFKKILLL